MLVQRPTWALYSIVLSFLFSDNCFFQSSDLLIGFGDRKAEGRTTEQCEEQNNVIGARSATKGRECETGS